MYEKFQSLLDKTNKTPYQVSKDTGISTAKGIQAMKIGLHQKNGVIFRETKYRRKKLSS